MINKTKLNNTKPGIAKYTHLNPTRFPKRKEQQPTASVNFLDAIATLPFDRTVGWVDSPKASHVPMPEKLLSELQVRRVFGERPMYIFCANYDN